MGREPCGDRLDRLHGVPDAGRSRSATGQRYSEVKKNLLPEDADKNLAGTAKQRDVYTLGRMANQILREGASLGSNGSNGTGPREG